MTTLLSAGQPRRGYGFSLVPALVSGCLSISSPTFSRAEAAETAIRLLRGAVRSSADCRMARRIGSVSEVCKEESQVCVGHARALLRYFASVLFAIAVIVGGGKIAVDHWPCEFMAKGACSARH
jgi:hypothetical protein